MLWKFSHVEIPQESAVHPTRNPVTLTGPRCRVYEPRRLTVPELERYIRGGCTCTVCEFARAEINARPKRTTL